MGMVFKKIFFSRVVLIVCLMFIFNVIFFNVSGKFFNFYFFKVVIVNCEEFKCVVIGLKCVLNG